MIGRWHGIDQDGDTVEQRADRAVLVRQIADCSAEVTRLLQDVEDGKKMLRVHRRRLTTLLKKAEKLGLTLAMP